MDLVHFLEANKLKILERWDAAAATMEPAAEDLSPDELRDHAGELLDAMVEDIRSSQSREAATEKARGDRPQNAPELTSRAKRHADDRLRQGFTLGQVVSEYRALRNNVVRSWADQNFEDDERLEELSRFHEAVDQALYESASAYTDRLADARELLQGVLAHDLRNSLAAITITIEMLRDENSSDQSRHDHVERIRHASGRMHRMINDVLDFAKTRLGQKLRIDRDRADLGDVCDTVLDEVRLLAPNTPVNVEKEGDLAGNWDASRLEQMTLNLVINAIRHGLDGGAVDVRAQGDGDDVVLTVHNSGEAISTSLAKIIFDPMLSAAVAEASGHEERHIGLGLYIARQVAEAHGGSIAVESKDDDGTTFTVRLPR